MRVTCCRQEGWGGLCPGKHGPHWQGEDGLLLIQALQYCCLCRCYPWAAQQVAAILWQRGLAQGKGGQCHAPAHRFACSCPALGPAHFTRANLHRLNAVQMQNVVIMGTGSFALEAMEAAGRNNAKHITLVSRPRKRCG